MKEKNEGKKMKEKITPARIRGIICIVLLLIGLGFALPVRLSVSDYEQQYADNEDAILTLTASLAEYESASEADAAEINADIYSAATLGERVAELQNQYQDIDAATDDEKITAISEELSGYFDQDRGQTPWYTASLDDYTAVWEFVTTYSFSDSSVPVIWLCYIDETEALVAYASASYDVNEGIFKDIIVEMTRTGYQYIGATGGDDASEYNSVVSLVDVLKEYAESSDIEVEVEDAEVLQQQASARAWLRSQYEEEE